MLALSLPSAAAQRLPAAFPTAPVAFEYRGGEHREALKLFPRAPDYRYEGAIVGATTLVVAGGVLFAGLCEQSDSINNCTGFLIKTSLLMAFIGGLTGALVGGMIPKAAEP